jgi:hypothetical protein
MTTMQITENDGGEFVRILADEETGTYMVRVGEQDRIGDDSTWHSTRRAGDPTRYDLRAAHREARYTSLETGLPLWQD